MTESTRFQQGSLMRVKNKTTLDLYTRAVSADKHLASGKQFDMLTASSILVLSAA